MAFLRGIDGSEPVRPEPVGRPAGTEEERRATRTTRLATGTLACPACDAPLHPGAEPIGPAHTLACPYCGRAARVRDCLSLAAPPRPTRVDVHVVHPARATAR